MQEHTVRISREMLSCFGSGTLIGLLTKSGITPPCRLTLLFEQTSIVWKCANGGPMLLKAAEHVPMCLVDDVVQMIQMGYEIAEIDEYTRDPDNDNGEED